MISALLSGAGCGKGSPPPPEAVQSRQTSEERKLVPLCGKLIGEPDAKVKVIAVLPVSVGCKDHLGLYLAAIGRKHPSMVSVRIEDMKSEQGLRVMQQHNLSCATILINGRSMFDLPEGGKVLLEGPNLGETEDLRRALAAELKAAYGDSAPELPAVPAGQ